MPVHEVPPGQHGWATAEAGPELAPMWTWGPWAPEPVEDPAEAAKLVRAAFEDSVRVRVDTDLPVGVILSGGLDSSLTLLHVREMHPDCVAFTVGAPGSEDLHYARRLCADLSVPHEVVELAPGQIGLAAIREAIAISELTEYGDIINAVVSVPLFRRVRQAGVKVVLTGDGSDELFGGYAMYDRAGPAAGRRLFLHKLATLGRTELQRVDRTSMAATVEARVPFLDLTLVELALRLPMSLKVRDGQEKWILREAFAGRCPTTSGGGPRTRCRTPRACTSGPGCTSRCSPGSIARSAMTGARRSAGTSRRCSRRAAMTWTRLSRGPRATTRRGSGQGPGRGACGGTRRRPRAGGRGGRAGPAGPAGPGGRLRLDCLT